MDKKFKVMATFGVLVVLVVGLYVFTDWISYATGYLKGEDSGVALVACLSGKGAEFYGNANCAECEKQQKEFGRAFERINYVDCGLEKENCPNIREIPAWYLNGEIHYGFLTIEDLKEIGGC